MRCGFVPSFFLGRVSKCVSYREPNLERRREREERELQENGLTKRREKGGDKLFFSLSLSLSVLLWSEILNLCRVIEFRLYDRKQGRKRAGQRGDFLG